MKQLIKKYPLAAYFTIVFGWTWLIVFALILAGTNVDQPTPQFIIGGMLCNISPTMAAFLITWLCKGKDGLRTWQNNWPR